MFLNYNEIDLIVNPGEHHFPRDRDPYRYQVTLWDGEEADRPAEKDLERNLLST